MQRGYFVKRRGCRALSWRRRTGCLEFAPSLNGTCSPNVSAGNQPFNFIITKLLMEQSAAKLATTRVPPGDHSVFRSSRESALADSKRAAYCTFGSIIPLLDDAFVKLPRRFRFWVNGWWSGFWGFSKVSFAFINILNISRFRLVRKFRMFLFLSLFQNDIKIGRLKNTCFDNRNFTVR